MKSDELFKIIEDHPNYMVSNHGRVLNISRKRFLRGERNQQGYVRVKLNGKRYALHRLIAIAFIPNPDNLYSVNHIDEDKENNAVWNLEWMSLGDNTRYSHARTYTVISPTGETVTFTGLQQFCRENNLSAGGLHDVITGKRPIHKGWTRC